MIRLKDFQGLRLIDTRAMSLIARINRMPHVLQSEFVSVLHHPPELPVAGLFESDTKAMFAQATAS